MTSKMADFYSCNWRYSCYVWIW